MRYKTAPMRDPALPTDVVTAFLLHEGKLLILRRSADAATYPRKWSGISGFLEMDPEEQARTEILEELGLDVGAAAGIAEPVSIAAGGRTWVVHPFLFQLTEKPEIRLNHENSEARWIRPIELAAYETVPGLDLVLKAVLELAP